MERGDTESYYLRRAAAFLFDYGFYLAFVRVYFGLMSVPTFHGDSLGGAEALIGFGFGWLVLFPVLEWRTNATLGKQLFSLRVKQLNGQRDLGFGRALLRRVFDPLDIFWMLWLRVFFTTEHQRLGDLVAKTKVVSLRKF